MNMRQAIIDQIPAPFRPATRADAQCLTELVNMAGEGLPLYLWGQMADAGKSAWEIGCERARRESGGFSYTNAVLRESGSDVVAGMIGYPLAKAPAPVDYSDMPPMFVPLQQLEDMAPGTWYVNVLATYPDHRGQGHGQSLLLLAESFCAQNNMRGLSIIVADFNTGARRLYKRQGYREIESRPMVKEGWQHPGSRWILMLKEQ